MGLTEMRRNLFFFLSTALLLLGLSACSGTPDPELANRCSNGIDAAYSELDWAKSEGQGAKGDWAKAASLLAGARIDRAFDEYINCLDKIEQARVYIKKSQSQPNVSSSATTQ